MCFVCLAKSTRTYGVEETPSGSQPLTKHSILPDR